MQDQLMRVALVLAVAGLAVALVRGDGAARLGQAFSPARGPADPPAPVATECFAAKLWQAEAADVNAGRLPKLLQVPPGWAPVGGTVATVGQVSVPAVVLCRGPIDGPPPMPQPAPKFH